MDGMYLIRGGTHAGAEKVLSVWHTDKCRHYRLFKDEVIFPFRKTWLLIVLFLLVLFCLSYEA